MAQLDMRFDMIVTLTSAEMRLISRALRNVERDEAEMALASALADELTRQRHAAVEGQAKALKKNVDAIGRQKE